MKPFPRGECAPVRTLGRMRNGDIYQLLMQLVKKVKTADYFRFNQVQYALPHLAVPHPSRLRRSTFPPGEGFGRCRASITERYRAIAQWPIVYYRTVHALPAGAARKIPICRASKKPGQP